MKRREFICSCAGASILLLPGGMALAKTANALPASGHTGIVLDDLFLQHVLEPDHPESPQRLRMIKQYLEESDLLPVIQRVTSVEHVARHLLSVHTPEHVSSIRKHYPDTFPVAGAVVGAAISAVDAVCSGSLKNAFCATRPPGHHATNTGREEGFCFFNAIAIAARHAQKEYRLRKILIVDWDYHHGNGTEAVFYADPEVLFFSTHDRYAYPGTGDPAKKGSGAGEGYNINIHLDCGATDEAILSAFQDRLVPVVEDFRPEMILVSAGFDSRADDLLGCFDITDSGFVRLTRLLMQLADKHCEGRLVSIMEGGYNVRGNASAVVHHVRTLAGS